jgi:hypothetical protein
MLSPPEREDRANDHQGKARQLRAPNEGGDGRAVAARHTARKVLVYLKVDPVSIDLRPGFTRDVSNIGHYATGDLEVTLAQMEDLERSKALLQQSYEAS